MKKLTLLFGVLLVFLFYSEPAHAHAETITKKEYREIVINLFKEFLQMKTDGVFMDDKTIDQLQRGGLVIPNRIRGDHPPGGYFARPPGSDWLERVEALRKVRIKGEKHSIVCFRLPKMPSGDSWICGGDLFQFYTAIGSKNQISKLDAIASKFWLATICFEKQSACKPYIKE